MRGNGSVGREVNRGLSDRGSAEGGDGRPEISDVVDLVLRECLADGHGVGVERQLGRCARDGHAVAVEARRKADAGGGVEIEVA